MLNHKWLWLLAALLAVVFGGGCVSDQKKGESITDYEARLEATSNWAARWHIELSLDADGVWGDGHVLGFGYNLSGSHGKFTIHASGKPTLTESAATQPSN